MQVVSLTEARNNLKAVFDSVYLDNDEVIIHRKGKENVVVISFDEYNSMKETNYLLSSPANRKQLLRSLTDARAGRTFERDLIEWTYHGPISLGKSICIGKHMIKKINTLIKDIKRAPFDGIGKPEQLKYELSGCWSRKITDEHRLVYEVHEFYVIIIGCRYHY